MCERGLGCRALLSIPTDSDFLDQGAAHLAENAEVQRRTPTYSAPPRPSRGTRCPRWPFNSRFMIQDSKLLLLQQLQPPLQPRAPARLEQDRIRRAEEGTCQIE